MRLRGTAAGARWARALSAAALLWALAAPARARDYGSFIDVDDPEDLLDLQATGELDEDDYETLLELLEDGVDLNATSRDELYALPNLNYQDVDAILAYRDQVGRIEHPADLVAAGILSEGKLLAIAAFLRASPPPGLLAEVSARATLQSTWLVPEARPPSTTLRAEVEALRYLQAGGAAVLTRNRVGEVAYDPNDWRDGLSAQPAGPQVHLPKLYLEWRSPAWHVIAGTFRIGFGQRLTLDNTAQEQPNGIRHDSTLTYNLDLSRLCRESLGELEDAPCTGDARYAYTAPDYRWTERFRGAAVGLRRLEVGPGWMQAYGFASHQTRSVYQYELVDRSTCEDPTDDEDPGCAAPRVFNRGDDPLAQSSQVAYAVLPDMVNEVAGGGNVTYFFGPRTHLGLTFYGAALDWLVEGMDLDLQETARLPYGGPFGAVGADGALGMDWLDLFLEVSRSLDSQPAGGGWAGLLRTTASFERQEFEAALRYYDRDFANPYARPIAAADEYDGLRARDEAGVRLGHSGDLGDLSLRSRLDLWLQPSTLIPRLDLRSRADYAVFAWLVPGLWAQYANKDLSRGGRESCYESGDEELEGEPVPCSGEKIQLGGQVRLSPWRPLGLTLKLQHRWIDDGRKDFDEAFRQDVLGWAVVTYQPLEVLRLRLRARYLNEGIFDNTYREHLLTTYAEVGWRYEYNVWLKLRYQLDAWLDERDSTQARQPNPAHWVRVELAVSY